MTDAAEVAWVIERYNHDTLLYWTGRPALGTWSANHAEALRFARKTDAAAMLTWHCDSLGRVAEHMWLAASTPVPSDEAQGETTRDVHDTHPSNKLPKLGGEFKETATGFTRRFRLDDPALDEYLSPNAPDGVF